MSSGTGSNDADKQFNQIMHLAPAPVATVRAACGACTNSSALVRGAFGACHRVIEPPRGVTERRARRVNAPFDAQSVVLAYAWRRDTTFAWSAIAAARRCVHHTHELSEHEFERPRRRSAASARLARPLLTVSEQQAPEAELLKPLHLRAAELLAGRRQDGGAESGGLATAGALKHHVRQGVSHSQSTHLGSF